EDSGTRIVPTQTSPDSLQFQKGAVISFVSGAGLASLAKARTLRLAPLTLNTNGGTGYRFPFSSPASLASLKNKTRCCARVHHTRSSEVRTRTDYGRISGATYAPKPSDNALKNSVVSGSASPKYGAAPSSAAFA